MIQSWLDMAGRPRALTILGVVILLAGGLRSAGPAYRLAIRQFNYHSAAVAWQQRDVSAPLKKGEVALWLRSPAADLDTPLLFGADEAGLSRFPGVDERGCLPGEGCLSVVLGHRDAHFRALGNLRSDDSVILETRNRGERWYWVSAIEILPKDELASRIEHRRHEDAVVLVTCFPLTYVGAAPKRLLIWLEPESFEVDLQVAM